MLFKCHGEAKCEVSNPRVYETADKGQNNLNKRCQNQIWLEGGRHIDIKAERCTKKMRKV